MVKSLMVSSASRLAPFAARVAVASSSRYGASGSTTAPSPSQTTNALMCQAARFRCSSREALTHAEGYRRARLFTLLIWKRSNCAVTENKV